MKRTVKMRGRRRRGLSFERATALIALHAGWANVGYMRSSPHAIGEACGDAVRGADLKREPELLERLTAAAEVSLGRWA